MLITVFVEGKEMPTVLEIPPECDYDLLTQIIEGETTISASEQFIEFNGVQLWEGKLTDCGVGEEDLLVLRQQKLPFMYPEAVPHEVLSSPDNLMRVYNEDKRILRLIQARDSQLVDAVKTGNITNVRKLVMSRIMAGHTDRYNMLNHSSDPDVQKRIEDKIRQENIDENMSFALEHLPESFGVVTMLYVDVSINNKPIKAFVDSGAQSTIMSKDCAERCGITRLIDTRFAGQAQGVGTAKILGRVHIAHMKFGNSVFPISITILESNTVDFLFGLDNLRRYRCVIDLVKNVLRIDGIDGPEEVSFLGESDIPDKSFGKG